MYVCKRLLQIKPVPQSTSGSSMLLCPIHSASGNKERSPGNKSIHPIRLAKFEAHKLAKEIGTSLDWSHQWFWWNPLLQGTVRVWHPHCSLPYCLSDNTPALDYGPPDCFTGREESCATPAAHATLSHSSHGKVTVFAKRENCQIRGVMTQTPPSSCAKAAITEWRVLLPHDTLIHHP